MTELAGGVGMTTHDLAIDDDPDADSVAYR